MQLRTYAKKNQVAAQDLIEALKGEFGGTWVFTSNLNDDALDFLNTTFAQSQAELPEPKEQLQLPASTTGSSITTQQPQDLTTQQPEELNTQNIPDNQKVTEPIIKTLVKAHLAADELEIQQEIDNHNARIVSIINNRHLPVENQLIASLQTKYQSIQNAPNQPDCINQSQTNLEKFNQLQQQLEAFKSANKS